MRLFQTTLAVVGLIGCAASTRPLQPVEKSEPESESAQGAARAPALPALSPRKLTYQGVMIDLPSSGFGPERQENGWSSLGDAARGVELKVRVGLERRSVTLAECESHASASLSVLRHEKSRLLVAGGVAQGGYFGQYRYAPLPEGGGIWVVFAVSTGRCLAAVWQVLPSADSPLWLTMGREVILPSLRRADPGDLEGVR